MGGSDWAHDELVQSKHGHDCEKSAQDEAQILGHQADEPVMIPHSLLTTCTEDTHRCAKQFSCCW